MVSRQSGRDPCNILLIYAFYKRWEVEYYRWSKLHRNTKNNCWVLSCVSKCIVQKVAKGLNISPQSNGHLKNITSCIIATVDKEREKQTASSKMPHSSEIEMFGGWKSSEVTIRFLTHPFILFRTPGALHHISNHRLVFTTTKSKQIKFKYTSAPKVCKIPYIRTNITFIHKTHWPIKVISHFTGVSQFK